MFISSSIAYFIALTSPGPDTAMIIKQCSEKGRSAGIYTALGIGIGILIHCILAVSGISLLALSYPPLKIFISIIGGAYIFYIGTSFFINKKKIPTNNTNNKGSFMIGLLTNILNIKAFIFFVSLFSILVESLSGVFYYLYPIYFSLSTALWFSFLSMLLTSDKYSYINIYNNFFIKCLMSITLCFIGLYIISNSIYEYF